MKKSIKKLNLNKKAISSLRETITGGARSIDTLRTTTDPTANTMCFICPDEPIRTFKDL